MATRILKRAVGYYPQLIKLYKHLGVQFCQKDFSYSFATVDSTRTDDKLQLSGPQQRSITTYMLYEGASGRNGISVPSSYFPYPKSAEPTLWERCVAYMAYTFSAFVLALFSLRIVLHSLPIRATDDGTSKHSAKLNNIIVETTFWGLLRVPVKFSAPQFLLSAMIRPPPRTTFREWVELTTPQSVLSKWLGLDVHWVKYAQEVLVPLFSGVCTASEQSIWDHPVEEFLGKPLCLTLRTRHMTFEF
jgi:hypothetical protein